MVLQVKYGRNDWEELTFIKDDATTTTKSVSHKW